MRKRVFRYSGIRAILKQTPDLAHALAGRDIYQEVLIAQHVANENSYSSWSLPRLPPEMERVVPLLPKQTFQARGLALEPQFDKSQNSANK